LRQRPFPNTITGRFMVVATFRVNCHRKEISYVSPLCLPLAEFAAKRYAIAHEQEQVPAEKTPGHPP
jgi:hypothetical protein